MPYQMSENMDETSEKNHGGRAKTLPSGFGVDPDQASPQEFRRSSLKHPGSRSLDNRIRAYKIPSERQQLKRRENKLGGVRHQKGFSQKDFQDKKDVKTFTSRMS